MKKVLIVVGALAVLVVVGLLLLFGNLDAIIKRAVEGFGSDATQSKVTLSSAHVSLTSGDAALKGLDVGNPSGYSKEPAFELGEISVRLDTSSLSSDTIVVKDVLIDGPRVVFELDASLGSNLQTIQANVDTYARRVGGGGSGDSGSDGAKDAKGGSKKFIVERLVIRGGRVRLGTTLTQGDELAAAEIPEIVLTDIGKSEGGVSGEKITAVLLDALTRASITAAARAGLEKKAQGLLDGVAGKAGDALKGLLGKPEEDEQPEKKGKKKGKKQ